MKTIFVQTDRMFNFFVKQPDVDNIALYPAWSIQCDSKLPNIINVLNMALNLAFVIPNDLFNLYLPLTVGIEAQPREN